MQQQQRKQAWSGGRACTHVSVVSAISRMALQQQSPHLFIARGALHKEHTRLASGKLHARLNAGHVQEHPSSLTEYNGVVVSSLEDGTACVQQQCCHS